MRVSYELFEHVLFYVVTTHIKIIIFVFNCDLINLIYLNNNLHCFFKYLYKAGFKCCNISKH